MRIQPIDPNQFEDVVELWERAGLTRPWNDPRLDLRRAVDGPSSAVLVGMDGEALVAAVMVGHDGHRGWVYYLAVGPDARGEGRGRAMMARRRGMAASAWRAEAQPHGAR